jgi:hypothetical protein
LNNIENGVEDLDGWSDDEWDSESDDEYDDEDDVEL